METEKTTDNTKSIFERTEVRKIKGNNEESIFFDSKEDALNCLRSHNGQNKSEEDLVRSEFAKDESGCYFIVMKKNAETYRG